MLRLECVLQSRGNHGQCISLLHIEGILLVGAAEGPHICHSQLNYLSSIITITPSHSNGEGADMKMMKELEIVNMMMMMMIS